MSNCLGSWHRTWSVTTLARSSRKRGPGLKNGALLTRAEDAGFAVFLTGDQNLPFQQNLSKRRLGVVVLVAASNALEDLLPLVPAALATFEMIQAGQTIRVEA